MQLSREAFTLHAAASVAFVRRAHVAIFLSLAAEESEYIHARDQLLGIAGSAVFITYAAIVLAGEPAHEEAHPYYNAPYTFVKRGANTGAEWWPGRQCQFFEFNCFAQVSGDITPCSIDWQLLFAGSPRSSCCLLTSIRPTSRPIRYVKERLWRAVDRDCRRCCCHATAAGHSSSPLQPLFVCFFPDAQ